MSKFWNILEKKNPYLPNQWRNGGSGAGNEHIFKGGLKSNRDGNLCQYFEHVTLC
jgi:hypothetical protein